MRIFLVRHGESNANVDWSENIRRADAAIELTAEGHEQAKEAGKFLAEWFNRLAGRHYPKIRLWHSPYKRAAQTADEIEATCLAAPCVGTENEPRKIAPPGVPGSLLPYFGDVRKPGESLFWDKKMHFLLYEQAHGIYDGLSNEERERDYPAEWAYYQKHKADGLKVLAQLPLGESRIEVATRIHQAFGTFHRDNEKHGIDNIVIVGHGTTNRCFAFAWLHKELEWLEKEPNPLNCSVRLIEDGKDRGYIFDGFKGGQHAGQ